ncbi:MAG: hypothetical protein IJE90_04825 [Clostridia bacterium]|nr:hypothetical protein [Clostridia bacterium]
MAKFKNVITGNIVSTENKATIALMEKFSTYVAVTGKAAKNGKDKKADGADGGNAAGGNADGGNADGGNADGGNAQ